MSADGTGRGIGSFGALACRKCGAEYAHSACRDPECPMRRPARPDPAPRQDAARRRAHLVVLGNAKGGAGKSTIAMHLIVALGRRGLSVASIDLDGSQGTLTRYVENRRAYAERSGLALEMPEHRRVCLSDVAVRSAAEREDAARLEAALAQLSDRDVVVVDTPGRDDFLARLGHRLADTLITPLNDSFLDLDVLARVDSEGRRIEALSRYSRTVLEQREERVRVGGRPFDWIVMRNRLAHIDARNKRDIGRLLEQLAERAHFRLAPGFGERVIFRELFLKGLTLLDLREEAADVSLTMSHVAARQELRALLRELALPSGAAPAAAAPGTRPADPAAGRGEHAWLARLPGHVRHAVLRTTSKP